MSQDLCRGAGPRPVSALLAIEIVRVTVRCFRHVTPRPERRKRKRTQVLQSLEVTERHGRARGNIVPAEHQVAAAREPGLGPVERALALLAGVEAEAIHTVAYDQVEPLRREILVEALERADD